MTMRGNVMSGNSEIGMCSIIATPAIASTTIVKSRAMSVIGLIRGLNIPAINEMFIRTQPAHLQKITGGELDTADRNIERARYLRRYLHKDEDGNGGAEHN
jgi:protein-arginine kinase